MRFNFFNNLCHIDKLAYDNAIILAYFFTNSLKSLHNRIVIVSGNARWRGGTKP